MNKIKIVNSDILHLMQSSAKQYKVNDELTTFQQNRLIRPKTPQQLLRTFIKQSSESILSQTRRQKLKTTGNHFGKTQHSQYPMRQNLAVIQKKFQSSQIRQRPNTAQAFRRERKHKTQKTGSKQEILVLKQQINSVLQQINEHHSLAKQRMKVKYSSYGYNKFGKFWNKYNVSLLKKQSVTKNKTKQLQDQHKINLLSDIIPSSRMLKVKNF